MKMWEKIYNSCISQSEYTKQGEVIKEEGGNKKRALLTRLFGC